MLMTHRCKTLKPGKHIQYNHLLYYSMEEVKHWFFEMMIRGNALYLAQPSQSMRSAIDHLQFRLMHLAM